MGPGSFGPGSPGSTPGASIASESQITAGLVELSIYGVVSLYEKYTEAPPANAAAPANGTAPTTPPGPPAPTPPAVPPGMPPGPMPPKMRRRVRR
jgi:hypothetical protein